MKYLPVGLRAENFIIIPDTKALSAYAFSKSMYSERSMYDPHVKS